MSNLFRREIPVLLTFGVIIFLFFDYFILTEFTRNVATMLQSWALIITATLVGVGIINATFRHVYTIKRRADYWYLDVWLLVIFTVTVAVGIVGGYGQSQWFQWIMKYVYMPTDSAVYAMVFFDVVYAFYRIFRLRSYESTYLFAAAIITMMRNTPLLSAYIPGVVSIGNWVINIPATASSSALLIVTAIGVIYFAIRMMFGYEKGTIGVLD